MPTFPSAPGYRMAYDIDGTIGFYTNPGTGPTGPNNSITAGDMINWNDENIITTLPIAMSFNVVGLVFPELRDIEGFYIALTEDGFQPPLLQTSTDTTNGVDGTWTTQVTNPPYDIAPSADGYYRRDAHNLSVSGVQGIRYSNANTGNTAQAVFHVYGVTHAGANPDRLMIWDPTSDVQLAQEALDPGSGGDVQRGQTYVRTFRVKNISGSKTASNTTVSASILTDNSPSILTGITFSIDAGPFASTINIASLAPGVISDVITMQYAVASNAQLHTANPRITAVPSAYA